VIELVCSGHGTASTRTRRTSPFSAVGWRRASSQITLGFFVIIKKFRYLVIMHNNCLCCTKVTLK